MYNDFYDRFRQPQMPPFSEFPSGGPGGGFPGRGPGGGFPGQGPGGGFPGQGPGGIQLPPPPEEIPLAGPSPYRVDPGAIRFCLYHYTYITLVNGRQFWFYPIYIGRDSIAGYRWSGFWWYYYGIDLDYIRSFTCV